jgi:AraC family transcriptional regulator
LAKIAVELAWALEQRRANGTPGRASARALARGSGWSVGDVLCTSGPSDRPFEERHTGVSIAVVVAGSFQYRSSRGGELMTPGSLLLGNAGESFECGHEYAEGDRCVAFHYDRDFFERLASESGAHRDPRFRLLRLPPVQGMSSLIAQACLGLEGSATISWEELSIMMAARTLRFAGSNPSNRGGDPPSALARITRAVRMIESNLHEDLTLTRMAEEARLSPYHFLRTFTNLTGLTPHQYVLRARLREVALGLAIGRKRVLDVALDSGFGDVSNFNRAFRTEFGVSPRRYREQGIPRVI